MRRLFLAVVLAASVAVGAADATNTVKKVRKQLTASEREAIQQRTYERFLAATGGKVRNESTGKGKIVFLNGQKRFTTESIKSMVDEYSLLFSLRMELQEGCGTLATADALLKKSGGNAAVFIVDDAGLPLSLVAYGNNWGMVNVAKLGDSDTKTLERRLLKELCRTVALTCGVADSGYLPGFLWPISSPAELDLLRHQDMPNPYLVTPVQNHMRRLGMEPMTVATYRKAVKEGWAPPPANEWQRSILEKIKSEDEGKGKNGTNDEVRKERK